MEMYERVSGARMHAAYINPGGVAIVSVCFMLLPETCATIVYLAYELKCRQTRQNQPEDRCQLKPYCKNYM